MMKKSILQGNPYLRDADKREKMLFTSVVSSTSIEGVRVTESMTEMGHQILEKTDTRMVLKYGKLITYPS